MGNGRIGSELLLFCIMVNLNSCFMIILEVKVCLFRFRNLLFPLLGVHSKFWNVHSL